MTLYSLDPYVARSSPVHAWDPRLKLVLTLTFILTLASLPGTAWPIYGVLAALDCAAVMLAELPARLVWRRSWPVLMVGAAALPLLWLTPGVPLWSLPAGPWNLAITGAGMVRVMTLLLKAGMAVSAVVVLTATASFPALLEAMEALGLPPLLVSIVGLMWRSLFVLVEEVGRLQRARDSRSGGEVRGSLIWRARVTGGMMGNLLLRALERSERIYQAMLARGYDGRPQFHSLPPLSGLEKAALWSGTGGLGLLALLAWWGWG